MPISKLVAPASLCIACWCLCLDATWAQELECGDLVTVADGVVTVTPSGEDDAANIQCAVDGAQTVGATTVRLTAGTFTVGQTVVAEGFGGIIEGRTQADTVVEIQDRVFDCDAAMANGNAPAAFKFVSGRPTVRFMTLLVDNPCGNRQAFIAIHFTGQPADAECGNDVIFAAADRIRVQGFESAPITAISATAEGALLGTCRDTLLGTLRVNRTRMNSVFVAVESRLKAGGQVDINFNDFSNTRTGVSVENANQNMAVVGNLFQGSGFTIDPYRPIWVRTNSADAPAANRVVIHNNEFVLSDLSSDLAPDRIGDSDTAATAITLEQRGRITNLSAVITNNEFGAAGGERARVLDVVNVSAGLVSRNEFGLFQGGVLRIAGDGSAVRDWTVVGNEFRTVPSFQPIQITLNEQTRNCIIGPDQGVNSIQDEGDNRALFEL